MDILLISSKCNTCSRHLNDTYIEIVPVVLDVVLLCDGWYCCVCIRWVSNTSIVLWVVIKISGQIHKIETLLITDKILTRLDSLSNIVSVLKETGTAYPS